MQKFIEGKLIVYLVASIIPLLSVSIFLADFICSFLAIFFLCFVIKNNIYAIFKNIFITFSIFFYLLIVFSSILSSDILFSLQSSLPFIRIIIFCLLISHLISNNKNFLKILYEFIKFTFLVLVLYGFIEYFYMHYNLSKKDLIDMVNIRLNLFITDEQKLGSYLVRLFGIFLALHIISNNHTRNQNLLFYILIVLTSIIILLSGERTSLFFLILFFLALFILINIKFKTKALFLILIISIFSVFLYFNKNLANRIIFDQNNQLKISKHQIIVFTPQHTAHYKTAFKMFLDKPIYGHGPKMFRIKCSDKKYNESVYIYIEFIKHEYTGCSNHPHNTYMQLIAETGIIGTLLFSFGLIFIIFVFFKHFFQLFIKKKYLSNYQIIICLSTLIIFWPFSPSGNLFNNWLLIVSSFPLGFFINNFFINKK